MNFKNKLIAGIGIAMAVLILIGATCYRVMLRSSADTAWVTHTLVVLEALGELEKAVTDAETNQRGFVITSDETYREPYLEAMEIAHRQVSRIRQLTADNPSQQRRLSEMQPTIEARFASLRNVMAVRESAGMNAAVEAVRAGQGKRAMIRIRSQIGDMEAEEKRLLGVRTREADASITLTKRVILLGYLASFLLLFAAGVMVAKEMARRRRLEDRVSELNLDLERRVEERTAELSDRTDQLAEANAGLSERAVELAHLNDELAEKTKELTRSNADLEQFAYVASHDLQEPLRMVASFTQLLARRYNDKLGDDAREFIQYAVDGATRLQTLIGDLLSYSRVGTHARPPKLTLCDDVLDGVMTSLKPAIEESGATITRDPLPRVMADPGQLGRLLQNLLTNAMKFRGERPAQIHIGARRDGGYWKVFVRDNGIGIAPEHAERIWIIFQRLHTKTEYPGTGIGLAICKKIAERHGGTIWVEPTPGGGSTFCFRIPVIDEAKTTEERVDEFRTAVTAD